MYDTNGPNLLGINNEFISSGRLDNLAMCQAGMSGFLNSFSKEKMVDFIPVIACFNHEEIGSTSSEGANSNIILQILLNIQHSLNQEKDSILKHTEDSFVVSADMAHALHPSHAHLYEKGHKPILNKGIVFKESSNLHYQSDLFLKAWFIDLVKSNHIPYQFYHHRMDIPCGSTLGKFVASKLGMQTLDIGTASLGMHSIRELCGKDDHKSIIKVASLFFQTE